MKNFDALQLDHRIFHAVRDVGYTEPTPIQAQAIPHVLEGRDVLGVAQTGTGKTAAFTLPILSNLSDPQEHSSHKGGGGKRPIRVLILTPTRELASQIKSSFDSYGRHRNFRSMVIFGGVSQKRQTKKLRKGVDVVVATPGRFIDLMDQGYLDLSDIEVFALDEADRMLDMGFINDMRRIMKKLPDHRQNLLFSATMPKGIAKLSKSILHNPVRIDIAPETPAIERIEQRVMFVRKKHKQKLLNHLIETEDVQKAIVFSRTKHGANRIVKRLKKQNISAAPIHGNKSQNARERALRKFRNGKVRVLVATNIAARGIDVDEITHVINYNIPNHAETYVHRIGRTARAGSDGISISFCDESEGKYLRKVERLIDKKVQAKTDHPWHHERAIPGGSKKKRRSKKRRKKKRRKKNRGKKNRAKNRQRKKERSR